MTALAATKGSTALSTEAVDQKQLMAILGDSIYPGAKPESVAMVISYCAATGLDPLLKPVHIVPMSVKQGNNYVWRDVIMQGIAQYRIQASRTGQYLGKSEPEFGPAHTGEFAGGKVKVTYPAWCKVTVRRLVGGQVAEFTATEFWTENYATAKRDTDAPNAMWSKRPFGQLAKCAEAQALRMAFPELIGGTHTAEEMEGKEIDATALRDVTPVDPHAAKADAKDKAKSKAKSQLDAFSGAKDEDPDDGDAPIDGTILPDLPEMPADIREAMEDGRWGRAWKWFEGTIMSLDAERRQAFADANKDVTARAMSGSAKVRDAVKGIAEDAGVEIDGN